MKVQEFFDPATFTLTYVVFDEASRDAVVIDPVLDFDPLAAETGSASVEKIIAFAKQSASRSLHPRDARARGPHHGSAAAEKATGGRGRHRGADHRGAEGLPTRVRPRRGAGHRR